MLCHGEAVATAHPCPWELLLAEVSMLGPCLSYSPTAWQPWAHTQALLSWAHLQAQSLAQPWPNHRELAWCNFVLLWDLCMCVVDFLLLTYLFIQIFSKIKVCCFCLISSSDEQMQAQNHLSPIKLRCQFSVLQIRLINDFNECSQFCISKQNNTCGWKLCRIALLSKFHW